MKQASWKYDQETKVTCQKQGREPLLISQFAVMVVLRFIIQTEIPRIIHKQCMRKLCNNTAHSVP